MSFSGPKRSCGPAPPACPAGGDSHSLATAKLTVALQKALALRPSEAVALGRALYAQAREQAAGGVPGERLIADVVQTEVFRRMADKVAAATAACEGSDSSAGGGSSPTSREPASADAARAAPRPAASSGASPSPGRRAGRMSPSEADIEALMSIPPGSSFINSLPAASLRRKTAFATAGAVRRNSAAGGGGSEQAAAAAAATSGGRLGAGAGPLTTSRGRLDVWGELDLAREAQLAHETALAKQKVEDEKRRYSAALAGQVREFKVIREAEDAKEAAYKASIRDAARAHEADLRAAEERRVAREESEATKFQAYNAAAQKLKAIEADKQRKYEQTHVARLKAEEEALTRQAAEKRVTALLELRTFLKENDEYIRGKHDAVKQARKDEAEAVKKSEAEALKKEQQREADIERRAEDMRKRMDKMSEVYREEEKKDNAAREQADREHAEYLAGIQAAEQRKLQNQKLELDELRRQLDAQQAHRLAKKAAEKAEEARLGAWMRDDHATMNRELSAKKRAQEAEMGAYRKRLEGQIGEAFTASAQLDETPFERARNQRLIAEMRSAASATTTASKGRC